METPIFRIRYLIIRITVHSNRPHAHLPRCPHDSACNLASVGDQHLVERPVIGGHM